MAGRVLIRLKNFLPNGNVHDLRILAVASFNRVEIRFRLDYYSGAQGHPDGA